MYNSAVFVVIYVNGGIYLFIYITEVFHVEKERTDFAIELLAVKKCFVWMKTSMSNGFVLVPVFFHRTTDSC